MMLQTSTLAPMIVATTLMCALVAGQIPPQYAVNITVFHVNPEEYGVAPINMNTADALGDMYFDLRTKGLPIECASGDPAAARDCDNAEVANNSALVITKLIVEIDSRTGDYGRCNICVNGTDNHGNNSCTNGVYDCTCGGFGPPEPCGQAVGVENITEHTKKQSCRGGDPAWQCWHDVTGHKTGGMWYSTYGAGYCGDGSSPPPAGCTWRVAEFVKRVNKTCSDNVIYNEVESVGLPCFDGCKDSGVGPKRNSSDPCWIGCFYDTVLGPDAGTPGGTIAGMPLSDLLVAWNLPFATTDPTKKGCPALKP
eukprot:m.163931 g.163931  ORF g.163931 m.163931 type:complete len:310 (-) comp23933_c0_seq4:143-1072(-)